MTMKYFVQMLRQLRTQYGAGYRVHQTPVGRGTGAGSVTPENGRESLIAETNRPARSHVRSMGCEEAERRRAAFGLRLLVVKARTEQEGDA